MASATTEFSKPISDELIEDVRDHRRLFLLIGLSLIVIGFAAVAAPRIASFTVELFIGATLAVGGAASFFLSFGARKARRTTGVAAVGLLGLVSGLLLLVFPVSGIVALTLVLAAYLVASGLIKGYFAWRARPSNAWGWLMAAAAASVILGVLIWSGLPGAALWVLGLIFGIDLIFYGTSFTAIALTAKSR